MALNQSNLPTVQRLKFEDYADAKDWKEAIQLLVTALNLFLQPVYQILNGGVTYQNLTIPQVVTKNITAGTTTTFSFTNPLSIAPSSVVVSNVWTGIPSVHPASAVQAFWHYSGNTIFIDSVIGLTSGTNYNITLTVN